MNRFTVVGFYPDTGQRFTESVEATSVAIAEVAVQGAYGINVVATFAGDLTPVDEEQWVRWAR